MIIRKLRKHYVFSITDRNAKNGKRTRLIHLLLLALGICVLLLTFHFQFDDPSVRIINPIPVRQYLRGNPWPPSPQEAEDQTQANLRYLSSILWTQIEALSSVDCSEGLSLHCGHFDTCGLGCQLHHRAACLMLSYSMGIPLIHDSMAGWPFWDPWEEAFQPLGSKCSVTERTIYVQWRFGAFPSLRLSNGSSITSVQYPFESGIPVDSEFLRLLSENHPDPFLWFVGQFLKYAMRLSDEMSLVVKDWLQKLPRGLPIAGFHVRRTDKIGEASTSFHEINEYFQATEAYFEQAMKSVSGPRTVYIASDDHNVLHEAEVAYPPPLWRIVGLETNETYEVQSKRKSRRALLSVLEDISALTSCNYVVCGLSSNICRLVFELLNANHYNAIQRLKSLDEYYRYLLAGHIIPGRLLPVYLIS